MIAEGCSILLIDGPHSPTLKKFSCSKDERERDRWANFCSRIAVFNLFYLGNAYSSVQYGNRENPTRWGLGPENNTRKTPEIPERMLGLLDAVRVRNEHRPDSS